MAVVVQLLIMLVIVTALLPTTSADRCREICQKEDLAIQCGTCLNRAPVRFGKRSSPEINVHVRGLGSMPPTNLLSLLLQRAAAAEAAESHQPQYAADSSVQFQLNYQ